MQQRSPRQLDRCLGGQFGKHETDVIVHRAFRMIIGRLFARYSRQQFGQYLRQQTALMKEIQTAGGIGWTKEFQQFIPNPFSTHSVNVVGHVSDSRKCGWIDLEIQLRR